MRRAVSVATAALLGGVVLAGCGGSSKAATGSSATTVTLQAVNTSFSPTQIQLKAGQKVTFVVVNGDHVEHNLTVADLKINTDVSGGTTKKVTATPAAGTYQFHCEYHPQQMNGTITVA